MLELLCHRCVINLSISDRSEDSTLMNGCSPNDRSRFLRMKEVMRYRLDTLLHRLLVIHECRLWLIASAWFRGRRRQRDSQEDRKPLLDMYSRQSHSLSGRGIAIGATLYKGCPLHQERQAAPPHKRNLKNEPSWHCSGCWAWSSGGCEDLGDGMAVLLVRGVRRCWSECGGEQKRHGRGKREDL